MVTQVAYRQATTEVLHSLRHSELKNIADLVTAMREDYQVQFVERILRGLTAQIQISITADNMTDDMQDCATKLEETWRDNLDKMTEAYAYGRTAFEIVYGYDPKYQKNYVKKLVDLPVQNTELKITEMGDFEGIRLYEAKARHDQKLECNEVIVRPPYAWWCAINATELEIHGRSLFLGAPQKSYERKQLLLDLRQKFCRKFVFGNPKAHVPSAVTDENGKTIDAFKVVGDMYDHSGSGGLWTFSNETRDGKWAWDIEETAAVKDVSPLDAVIDGMDVEILRAFGILEKVVIEGAQVGSYAMITIQLLILYSIIESLVAQLLRSYKQHVVDAVVRLNWDPQQSNYPDFRCTYKSLADRNNLIVQEIVKSVLTSSNPSPLIIQGILDVTKLLEQVGMPLGTDLEAKIQKLMAMPSSSSPSPAPVAGAFSESRLTSPAGPVTKARQKVYPELRRLERLSERIRTGKITTKAALSLFQLEYPRFPARNARKILNEARPPTAFLSTEEEKDPGFFELASPEDSKPSVRGVPRADVLADRMTVVVWKLLEKWSGLIAKGQDAEARSVQTLIDLMLLDGYVAAGVIGALSPWAKSAQPMPKKNPDAITTKLPTSIKLGTA